MRKHHTLNYRFEAWDMLQHIFKRKKITDHTMRFVAKFSGRLDLDRLNKAVNLSSEAFPLIRSRLNENRYRPRWEDGNYLANDIVYFVESTSISEIVTRFLRESVDAFCGPQLKIAVIRSENTDTLCILINHMLCDAAGFKEYLYILSEIYMDWESKSEYKAWTMGNRKIEQIYQTFSFRDRLKILFSKSNGTPDPTEFEFEEAAGSPFAELRMIPREQFTRLKIYAKEHDATVNDVFLTAYIRLLYRYFGHTVIVPCVVDLRKYLPNRKAKGICNLISNLTCDIGPEPGSLFEQTLLKVVKAMDKEKADISCVKSPVVMEKAYNILPYKLTRSIVEKVYSDSKIEFTNIGVIDKSKLLFGEAEINEAYILGSIKYRPHFELSVSTFDDAATFCVHYSGTSSDREKISLFLNELVSELKNIY